MSTVLWPAHSAGIAGTEQSQQEHLTRVSARALDRCPSFLALDVELACLFHDFGKYSDLMRRRIRGERVSGLDHWSPGAHVLLRSTRPSHLAAAAVHGHHVGLGPWSQVSRLVEMPLASLEGRTLALATDDELRGALEDMAGDGLRPPALPETRHLCGTVSSMLDARMVLSALVDADYADTARHKSGERRPMVNPIDPDVALNERVRIHLQRLGLGASDEVRKVRADLWAAALAAAARPPGLFELEAPTGSGKTLAMLGFALQHMMAHKAEHGLHRIVVALPFLSILDQTVDAYRAALGDQAADLLEHHSLAEWRRPVEEDNDAERRRVAEALSEDWQAPIIVTTTVQLLESLFTNRPSASRKLCALAKSVILLDEAQTIPGHLILPTIRALARLTHPDYGSTVVVATATQPLFSRFAPAVEEEAGSGGWHPSPIAPRSLGLYARSARYAADWSRCGQAIPWADIAAEVAEQRRALCIVNTKKDARRLVELVLRARGERRLRSEVEHLSTNLCAAHRRDVLARAHVQSREAGCVLITTQCVEAGVDLDFPVVYRALAPLDAIAQAGGRCNRAGLGAGDVRIFLPEDARYPGKSYEQGALETLALLHLRRGELDPQDPGVFDEYFERLYGLRASAGTTPRMEKAVREADFPQVANLYRLIDRRDLVHIVVPYRGRPETPDRLNGAWFRAAQPYVVDANRRDAAISVWLGAPLRGTEDWYELTEPSDTAGQECVYHEVFGLRLDLELYTC